MRSLASNLLLRASARVLLDGDAPSSVLVASADASVFPTASPSDPTSLAPSPSAMVVSEQYVENNVIALSVVLLASYSVMCLFCVALLSYMRYNRHVVHNKGDSTAARKILLPAFEPLLWILCVAAGGFAAYFVVAISLEKYQRDVPSVSAECFYAGRVFMMLLAVVFMLQKSVTIPALRRAVLVTLVLSTYTIPVVWFVTENNEREHAERNFWILVISHALLLVLFAYVALFPPGRASKATLRQYCAFGLVQQVLEFAYMAAFHQQNIELGFAFLYADLLWGALCPFVIWRVLKADTEHWRGLGQRACALQSLFRQRTNVNERISSQGLHVLIEMHRKYIIDFAYLELKHRIGMGSSAVVYNGVLNSKMPVAIKVYTPTTVTEETVAEFSHEAALCGALNHPNIVKFYGMCVCPPTICLVSELCQGSLDAVTVSFAAHRLKEPSRQQLLIDLGYMIDAARAVAYIHSFSPAFVHRDIKPANFLVDSEGNVKLTDFGESRSLPKANIEWENSASQATSEAAKSGSGSHLRNSTVVAIAVVGDSDELGAHMYQEYSNVVKERARRASLSSRGSDGKQQQQQLTEKARAATKMTVKGTADYMAPEVINGRAGFAAYGEAADVYSLAITMWDILHPGVDKYPSANKNHMLVYECVVAGARPALDETRVHPGLREIISLAWEADPRLRPSAQQIVAALESVQEEVCAVFALELMDELEPDMVVAKSTGGGGGGGVLTVRCFSGQQGITKLRDLGSVTSSREGLRLGNMLMDAGFLHHIKHARAYEYNDALYFFDDDNLQLCQPFAMLEGGQRQHNSDDEESAATYDDEREHSGSGTTDPRLSSPERHVLKRSFRKKATSLGWHRATGVGAKSPGVAETSGSHGHASELDLSAECACQKLGQRLDNHKTARRRFRRRYRTIPEENLLTVNLLHDEMSTTQNARLLDEFNETGSTVIVASSERT